VLLFCGFGLSYVKDALALLQSRYNERFEFVKGVRSTQIHLFLVKGGLWSLAWTFIPKHFEEAGLSISVDGAARLVLIWLGGDNPDAWRRLDTSIRSAIKRVEEKLGGHI
jgi:hypothetical protein